MAYQWRLISMKTIVVFDSFFGNTEKIARAIGSALGSPEDVSIFRVSEITPEKLRGAGLILVGSPTRAFRPTKAIQEFLKSIPQDGIAGARVAAFDTRADVTTVNNAFLTFFVKIFGYAADPIARQLQKKGGKLAAYPEGFFIEASEGPLRNGELERAAAWAAQITRSL
jgi:flavodoxin